ncbi:MAG TPA: glycerophosphodiester phosphodiesterase [Cyclobacteriaceae bacterium]|nr:glycerophosphodiester phosphodiesterase [Cyclobacteriaceae bacterium]
MMDRRSFLLSSAAILAACSKNEITIPPAGQDGNLAGTGPLPQSVMKNMEGIYKQSGGNGGLGSNFVCKASRFKISFFSNLNGISVILKYGLNTNTGAIEFSGFWRVTEDNVQGLANFTMAAADGATDFLLTGNPSSIKLKGVFKNADGSDPRNVEIQFSKAFTTFAKNNPFMIFGHHGISTTANPPYAENSLDAARYAEDYGLTGIEYDIRLTLDNVPICIHDPSINIRLTKKGPLAGYYDQYKFNFLTQFVDLIDGQKIPSVEQVLDVVIDETNLSHVWLDIKGNPNVFAHLEPIVRAKVAKASAANRKLTIFAGLPSDEVIAEFNNQPSYSGGGGTVPLPTLAEVSLDDVIATKSSYFGPRYSEGLLLSDVERAHSMGVKVISWTLNDKNIIRNYLQNGKFDGFITDYPAYVVYDYYTMY